MDSRIETSVSGESIQSFCKPLPKSQKIHAWRRIATSTSAIQRIWQFVSHFDKNSQYLEKQKRTFLLDKLLESLQG